MVRRRRFLFQANIAFGQQEWLAREAFKNIPDVGFSNSKEFARYRAADDALVEWFGQYNAWNFCSWSGDRVPREELILSSTPSFTLLSATVNRGSSASMRVPALSLVQANIPCPFPGTGLMVYRSGILFSGFDLDFASDVKQEKNGGSIHSK